MFWAPYGKYWLQARKVWRTELLSARQLSSHEHVRREEIRALLRDLRAAALRDHLFMLNLSVISRMVMGKKYVAVEDDAGPAATPEEVRCWTGSWSVLDEHDGRRRREGEGFVPRDMVDQLLRLAEDPSMEVPITRDGIKAFVLDSIAAGTDTSAVTVEWALSELLRNPTALATATEELDRVVARDRLATEPSPLLSPRMCHDDVSVGGYDIPAGTCVAVNAWAIGRDPAEWDSPGEFRPERFIDSGVDVKGQDFKLLPFGSARRMCPGIGLGLKLVHVTLANLLHAFAWRLPDGGAAAGLNMEEELRFTMPRKVPLEATAEPKLPARLYSEP
ncbi:hypothetical protein ACP70R_005706 [Stipagrostis hirtigluma subsp. patula]